jgi:hypothetical protein
MGFREFGVQEVGAIVPSEARTLIQKPGMATLSRNFSINGFGGARHGLPVVEEIEGW